MDTNNKKFTELLKKCRLPFEEHIEENLRTALDFWPRTEEEIALNIPGTSPWPKKPYKLRGYELTGEQELAKRHKEWTEINGLGMKKRKNPEKNIEKIIEYEKKKLKIACSVWLEYPNMKKTTKKRKDPPGPALPEGTQQGGSLPIPPPALPEGTQQGGPIPPPALPESEQAKSAVDALLEDDLDEPMKQAVAVDQDALGGAHIMLTHYENARDETKNALRDVQRKLDKAKGELFQLQRDITTKDRKIVELQAVIEKQCPAEMKEAVKDTYLQDARKKLDQAERQLQIKEGEWKIERMKWENVVPWYTPKMHEETQQRIKDLEELVRKKIDLDVWEENQELYKKTSSLTKEIEEIRADAKLLAQDVFPTLDIVKLRELGQKYCMLKYIDSCSERSADHDYKIMKQQDINRETYKVLYKQSRLLAAKVKEIDGPTEWKKQLEEAQLRLSTFEKKAAHKKSMDESVSASASEDEEEEDEEEED